MVTIPINNRRCSTQRFSPTGFILNAPTLTALAQSFCARIQVKTYPFSSILTKTPTCLTNVEVVVADSKYGTMANFFDCHDHGITAHMPVLKQTQDRQERRRKIFPESRFIYDPHSNTYKRHERQDLLDHLRTQARSPAARRDIRIRQHFMEGSFAQATRFGLKRARWRGLVACTDSRLSDCHRAEYRTAHRPCLTKTQSHFGFGEYERKQTAVEGSLEVVWRCQCSPEGLISGKWQLHA